MNEQVEIISQVTIDHREARFASECNKKLIHLNLPPMENILSDAYQLGYLHGLLAERKRKEEKVNGAS